jgi:phosphoadenosine phosphosulfate reductase
VRGCALLQSQALDTIRTAVEASQHPAFPCALIAGDVVILELLDRAGYLRSGRVPVIFIDTLHLFPETLDFLQRLQVGGPFLQD